MVHVQVTRSGRVTCRTSLALPATAGRVWGQMRDFRQFVTHDPFHVAVRMEARRPEAGARFDLIHGLAGVRFARCGRILKWTEGEGYIFSDLSKRSVHAGFPHVYEYRVEPLGDDVSRLTVEVRGRWTATLLPTAITRAWLIGVMWLIRWHLAIAWASLRAPLQSRFDGNGAR